jgi:hypothetical protein
MAGSTAYSQQGTSPDEEEPDYVKEIETEYTVVSAPEVVDRVQSVASRLLKVIPEAATEERKVVVKVLDDPMVNAFSLPDGHIYLFKGLYEDCSTEDMLAAVMAHEMVHIFHHHHSRLGERQIRGMLLGIVAAAASGDAGGLIFGQMVAASMVETYGRNAEEDADRTSVGYVIDAGFDPLASLELMQVLEQESIHEPTPGGNYFTIHPDPSQRIASIRGILEQRGIEVPDVVYRVHLPLAFYIPLKESEKALLDSWDSQRAGDSGQDTENKEDQVEIPTALLNEYHLRESLFSGITVPDDRAIGVVTVDGTGLFYLSDSTEAELQARADGIIESLGEVFLAGLRNYEVQGSVVDGSPTLVARRRAIVAATEGDARLLGITPEEMNDKRVALLKDILFKYYVTLRI